MRDSNLEQVRGGCLNRRGHGIARVRCARLADRTARILSSLPGLCSDCRHREGSLLRFVGPRQDKLSLSCPRQQCLVVQIPLETE